MAGTPWQGNGTRAGESIDQFRLDVLVGLSVGLAIFALTMLLHVIPLFEGMLP